MLKIRIDKNRKISFCSDFKMRIDKKRKINFYSDPSKVLWLMLKKPTSDDNSIVSFTFPISLIMWQLVDNLRPSDDLRHTEENYLTLRWWVPIWDIMMVLSPVSHAANTDKLMTKVVFIGTLVQEMSS